MEKAEYYLVTVDVDSLEFYSLDKIQRRIQYVLDEHLHLAYAKATVASVHHVKEEKDNDGYVKVEGKQYLADGKKK